ncbi:hypothetical protein ACLKA7_015302 [Drosophila subpalustris]
MLQLLSASFWLVVLPAPAPFRPATAVATGTAAVAATAPDASGGAGGASTLYELLGASSVTRHATLSTSRRISDDLTAVREGDRRTEEVLLQEATVRVPVRVALN